MRRKPDVRAALSRSGVTHPLGKFTAEFPKFKGPEETHRILTERAARAGMTLAELEREILMIAAHGKEEVMSMYRARLEVVEGKGEERG